MNIDRWKLLMKDFDFEENKDTYNYIHKKYSEKHRAYHNIEHISDCLSKLDSITAKVLFRKEIELSIWFHDVIYNPYGKENELKSAKKAIDFLEKQSNNEELKSRIYDLIMVTLHNRKPTNEAEKIIMDIDISILGSDYNEYKTYSKKIRKEYKMVPSILYKKKRKEILSSFIKKDKLYYSNYFCDLEMNARNNLRREILEL
jgi:predicted metal-dependent HD superfamily phosphohydrolase